MTVTVGRAMATSAALGTSEDASGLLVIKVGALAFLADVNAHTLSAAKILGALGAIDTHVAACVSALVGGAIAPTLVPFLCSRRGSCQVSLRCRNNLLQNRRLTLLSMLLMHCPTYTTQRRGFLGKLRGI